LHHEAQVGLHHALLGLLVAGADTHGQRVLLLAREQRDAGDLAEVHAEIRAALLARLLADVLVDRVEQWLERLVGDRFLGFATTHAPRPRPTPSRARPAPGAA